jgi:hypothetical protein
MTPVKSALEALYRTMNFFTPRPPSRIFRATAHRPIVGANGAVVRTTS